MSSILQGATPRSIAIVGASERQFFARWTLLNLERTGYAGRILPVNRRGEPVLGHQAWSSVADLPGDPDLGVVALRPAACLGACEALAERGCTTVIVISDGFSESGARTGHDLEHQLVEWARGAGVTLLGPNCVGFADLAAGTVVVGMPMPTMRSGPVSVVSQSGGLLSSMVDALALEGLGVDLALSLGNGASFDLADALEVCAARPGTDAVVAYVETLGPDAQRVRRAIERLREGGRAVLVVKPGRSETARDMVQSHTASIAGDDAAVGALLDSCGVVRLDDIGDLARAARLVLVLGSGSAARQGIAVIGASGGSASIVGDLAMLHGVPLAEFNTETQSRLAELIPDTGHVGNPVDLSGRAADVPQDAVMRTIARDQGVAALLVPFSAPYPTDDPARSSHRDYLEQLAAVSVETGTPLIVATMGPQLRTDWVDAYSARHPLAVIAEGMASTMRALGALPWAHQPGPDRGTSSVSGGEARHPGVWSERDGRALLERHGIAVVPGITVAGAASAAEGAAALGFPVVVKAVLPGVAHKGRVGGVELGVLTPAGVGRACERISERLARHGLEADGFLVQQQVSGGIELLCDVMVNDVVGPVVTLGLGGVLAEATTHHATAMVPLSDEGWHLLVQRAGLDRLLRGPVGVAARATVVRLAEVFSDLRVQGVHELEINPLFLTSDGHALAGDVLVVQTPPMNQGAHTP